MSATKIGKYLVERVVEQERPFALAQKFFPDLTSDMLEACRRELPMGHIMPDDRLMMSFHSFVVKTGRHVILFDTCCGNHKNRPERPEFNGLDNDFLGALAAANVKPEDVDYVMCTHLHWDHVGWNTKLVNGAWQPTFPNAKHIVSKTEYEYWDHQYQKGVVSSHTRAFEDSVLPIKRTEQIQLVNDDFELDNGISVEPCPGHSPGNFVIHIASNGERGIVTGDVIHHQIQLRFPEISTSADANPDLARKNRVALIEKHAGTGCILLPAHFPSPSIGRIEPWKNGGFHFNSDGF